MSKLVAQFSKSGDGTVQIQLTIKHSHFMKNYYFSFGQGHISLEGDKMSDYWVRVVAKDEMSAREYFAEHFALPIMGSRTKWAFSYEEENFQPHYFPGGEYDFFMTEEATAEMALKNGDL